MSGKLILVPTPLAQETPLEGVALELLKQFSLDLNVIIAVEEHREARRRWLKWGLPRETIEKFVLFNEHTQNTLAPELIKELKNGKDIYLMSDGGMPAFCDPGLQLIKLCHQSQIQVTSTPFPNSPILALVLSGFDSHQFIFQGFLPLKEPQRSQMIKMCLQEKRTQILMDTPYRLHQVLSEFKLHMSSGISREVSMCVDLSHSTEQVVRGNIDAVTKKLEIIQKAEFIFLLGPI